MESAADQKKGLKWRKPVLKAIQTKEYFKEEEEEEVLSPSARLFHEPNFNVYIIAITGLKTPIHPPTVKAHLVHTLLKHPRFSSLQVEDEEDNKTMKWVKTRVDLEKHIIVPKFDQNKIQHPEKWIEDYIFELTKSSISKSQPLWDLHLLNLKTRDSESVAVMRIHHSLGDGTSLMSLLLACTRRTSDPNALPTIPTAGKNKNNKRELQLKYGRILRFLMGIWWFFGLVFNTVIDVSMFIATVLFLRDTETPLKGGEGVEFTPRRFVWRTLSLDDFKSVKNAMNATINDVALGATQAGLSCYLNRKYGHGDGEEGSTQVKNNLPKNIRLRATLLINVRPVTGIQALADMMEKDTKAKWGNWIGYVILPFTLGIFDDPLDYVRQAKSTVDRKKHSLEAFFTFCISEVFLKLFGIKKASGLSHRALHHTTMCFSNLVGPEDELIFYGHQLSYIAPSSYNQPHALMINFQSYANKMSIVLSVDEGTIPDPHRLIDDIITSFNLIKQAAISTCM